MSAATTPPTCAASDIIRVAHNSRTVAVAGAIAGVIRDCCRAEVQAIGAGAVNTAAKAIATATKYMEPEGVILSSRILFVEVDIDGQQRTALRFLVDAWPATLG